MLAEDYALVLDYIPKSRSTGFKEEASAQVLGEKYFTLLEVVPKTELKPLEKVYIGKEEREKIEFIKKRIDFSDLTPGSQAEIENAIEKIVEEDKARFVAFFNSSTPITLRRHQLELLPSLGKKHLKDILEEREKKPFESLEEIKKRIPLMPDPKKIIIKRILEELSDENQKHYLFARPPKKQRSNFRGR
ncbi:MAG: DUF655 domain-containing protein [Candidatus Diapherotrites archaeon]